MKKVYICFTQIFFSYIFYADPIFPFEQLNKKALATDLQVLSSPSIVQCICIKDHVNNKVDNANVISCDTCLSYYFKDRKVFDKRWSAKF